MAFRFLAGDVSSKHNVASVLEDNGRISLQPLAAGAEGGICGAHDRLIFPAERIGPRSKPQPRNGTLRFTPDGSDSSLLTRRERLWSLTLRKWLWNLNVGDKGLMRPRTQCHEYLEGRMPNMFPNRGLAHLIISRWIARQADRRCYHDRRL